jgi:hypothetical protein
MPSDLADLEVQLRSGISAVLQGQQTAKAALNQVAPTGGAACAEPD